MKTVLATVNITPDGRIQANPDMLVMPEKPTKNMKSEDGMFEWTKYEGDKQQWNSGLVDFEFPEKATTAIGIKCVDFENEEYIPGTYTVELPEFGVVKQCRNEDYDEWKDDKKFFSNYPFSTRRVLRFKV